MESEQIKEHFRRQVPDYEALMRRIIPEYDFQARLLIDLIPFETSSNIRVLDLGAGPATLSQLVLMRFPNARVVAQDLTEDMLEAARARCAEFARRFSTVAGDFRTDELGSGYDVVMTGLALHHLADSERQFAFRRIRSALNPSGIFVAREIVADDDPFVAAWHYRLWCSFMSTNGEDAEAWYQKHLAKDHPASVDSQLTWLRQTGFQHVACHWKHMNFAVLSAHAPSR